MPSHIFNELRTFMHGDGAAVLPEMELLLFALGIAVMDGWISAKEKYWNAALALAGTFFSGITLWLFRGQIAERGDLSGFHGSVLVDAFFLFFAALILVAAGFVILLAAKYSSVAAQNLGRMYVLTLCASAGLMLMVSAGDLLVVFLALECATLSCYFLSAMTPAGRVPPAISINYVLTSALGSGLLAYGFSLVYGVTGTTSFSQAASMLGRRNSVAKVIAISQQPGERGAHFSQLLQARMPEAVHWHPWVLHALPVAALTLIATALVIKIAALSFFRTPKDLTPGVLVEFRAFAGSAFFISALAMFLRVCLTIFGDAQEVWLYVLGGLALIVIAGGIVGAFRAENAENMLTSSLMAHAGYVLLGVLAANERSVTGATFYLFTFLFPVLGTFAILMIVRFAFAGEEDWTQLDGLAARNGIAAALVTVFLLSLAGIPPTAGFLGRYFIVRGLVESKHILLAWFLAFSSLALAYCYLRVAVRVWKKTAAQVLPLPLYGMMTAMLAVCLFVSLAAGIYAEPFTRLARYALGQ